MKLTRRQQELLSYIEQRLEQDGIPPTRSEINRHFGWRSPNAAQSHLRALAAKGVIELNPGLARGIRLTRPPVGEHELPLIGRVAAGRPMLALENQIDRIRLDPALFGRRADYLLQVHGESMREAGIRDGDLVAVQRTAQPQLGEIVVARLGDEVTVKRLKRAGHAIWLEPANPDFAPIRVGPDHEFSIEGRVVGVIRRL
ncbi:MAG: transcriptional repressor LexA [Wenzhouxiangellaceae bacterium]